MSALVLRSTALSHVGHIRELNEDSFLERPDLGLWAIADGMGGHEFGEHASRLITARLGELPAPPDAPTLARSVQAALGRCHDELRRFAGPDRICGSTVVALLVFDGHFAGLWVGDSRLYRLRAGRLEQLSRDHSLVQELIERGELSEDAARRHPLRHQMTRAVGVGDRLEVGVVQDRLAVGDLYLLCSDGLTGELEDAEIEATLRAAAPEAAAEDLLARALASEARDNLTLILVRCEQQGPEPGSTLPRGSPA
jgi:serine/threonine protein phosphatase PrpC